MIYYDRLLDNEPFSVTETNIVEKRKEKKHDLPAPPSSIFWT